MRLAFQDAHNEARFTEALLGASQPARDLAFVQSEQWLDFMIYGFANDVHRHLVARRRQLLLLCAP